MTDLAQLKWQCRRGMKELDVVLQRYLDQYYAQADATELTALQALLALQDDVLYACLLEQYPVNDTAQQQLLAKLRHI